MHERGEGGTSGCAHVRARKRMSLGREDVRVRGDEGHLEVLKYARENGCPWDETTCAAAAKNGHLETLKWARENGAPRGP